eukprot:7691871-Pyramimonas_sp.AAC.1
MPREGPELNRSSMVVWAIQQAQEKPISATRAPTCSPNPLRQASEGRTSRSSEARTPGSTK